MALQTICLVMPYHNKERRHMAQIPYANMVEFLVYAMICIRPDIAHAVNVVSKFTANPRNDH